MFDKKYLVHFWNPKDNKVILKDDDGNYILTKIPIDPFSKLYWEVYHDDSKLIKHLLLDNQNIDQEFANLLSKIELNFKLREFSEFETLLSRLYEAQKQYMLEISIYREDDTIKFTFIDNLVSLLKHAPEQEIKDCLYVISKKHPSSENLKVLIQSFLENIDKLKLKDEATKNILAKNMHLYNMCSMEINQQKNSRFNEKTDGDELSRTVSCVSMESSKFNKKL